ncbi:hypothetical protein STVIR_0218 [Streptomyces viridochromogenes Tue57]|uniref:Uncharacterized protein n=1 Tax=Streptomyces viridochromogenes Tue57 TaxID=1160705 RepID=L8PQP6_STRVR|nr:hypothetical protein STVIR_0218 [Streptomyces viridochromogenes Tue57]
MGHPGPRAGTEQSDAHAAASHCAEVSATDAGPLGRSVVRFGCSVEGERVTPTVTSRKRIGGRSCRRDSVVLSLNAFSFFYWTSGGGPARLVSVRHGPRATARPAGRRRPPIHTPFPASIPAQSLH